MSGFVEAFLDFVFDCVLPGIGFLLACAVLMAGVIVGIRYTSHHFDEKACASFSVQSGRETKFVDYTWWSWACLTPAHDGKWISTDALREVVR